MASFFDLFRRGITDYTVSDEIIENLNYIREAENEEVIREQVEIREDNRNTGNDVISGQIQSVITESKASYSPDTLARMLGEDDGKNSRTDQFLTSLRADMNLNETFVENEEMSRDSVIGSAMEIIADDSCQKDERTGMVVNIESEDEGLEKFLEDFLINNVNIEDRIWTWTYEVVKHGDFKLRRREYYTGSDKSGVKNVYYEDVINPYLVSRIEYMGNVIGYEDEDIDSDYSVATSDPAYGNSVTTLGGQAKFEGADEFVHFISSKLSKRIKVRLNIKNNEDKLETITCYKVVGTSIVDNVRYIYRIINMLDNMLVLSRLARSTQYNLVKVEVGNASAGKTQQILMDVRRRIEGSTKMRKGVGMQTDPSPIPVNSNVYLPTREGRGDVTVDPVGDNVDVRAIVDIDYFRDKEFAALKIPKSYMGFEECLKYDNKVRLLDGHVYEIGYLAEHPELWENKLIMTCSPEGVWEPSRIVHVKKTRKDATYVRVNIDNGEHIDVTPDHLMMLKDGTFVEAGKLDKDNILMPFNAVNELYVNPTVVSVETLCNEDSSFVREDAYDLGVESENHTFPLEAGVFVHNSLAGSLGNNSLAKMDIRYARSVQRVQNILSNGVRELCNNYLRYRGRKSDVNKFKIVMRPITTSESAERVEDWLTATQAFDASTNMLQEYAPYIDKAKFLKSMLGLVGLSPSEIGNKEFLTILQELEKGTYDEEKHKVEQPTEQEQGW